MNAAARTRLRHVAGAATGLAVFALVYFYVGDADLWTAMACGIAAALVFYLSGHLGDAQIPDGSS